MQQRAATITIILFWPKSSEAILARFDYAIRNAKVFRGRVLSFERDERYGRLCESTGTGEQDEAERHLRLKLTEIREATVYGVSP